MVSPYRTEGVSTRRIRRSGDNRRNRGRATGLFAPSVLELRSPPYPQLAPWAVFFRRPVSGAHLPSCELFLLLGFDFFRGGLGGGLVGRLRRGFRGGLWPGGCGVWF